MPMAQRFRDDERRTRGVAAGTQIPRNSSDLRGWIREEMPLVEEHANRLFAAIESVLAAQRQLIEESKHEAIRALSEGFAEKLSRLQGQLSEKDVTVSNIARYFEEVVAGLTDINSFKNYNDTLGHSVGDKIIERVARILSDQIRSEDFLALERGGDTRDLHARFGGDEFCFLIPDLPGCTEAVEIADRFKHAVEAHDWSRDDRRLASNPVRVDVGVVCLRLGPVADRRGVARKLAADLIHRADQLMYDAKGRKADHVFQTAVEVRDGALTGIDVEFVKS